MCLWLVGVTGRSWDLGIWSRAINCYHVVTRHRSAYVVPRERPILASSCAGNLNAMMGAIRGVPCTNMKDMKSIINYNFKEVPLLM